MKDWENAYQKFGELQFVAMDLVKNSVSLLKNHGAKKVLDLCFGTGRHTIFLAENGFDVYGIDISATGKAITEKKIAKRNLTNIHLIIADMHDLPYNDNFFDAVIAVNALEHNNQAGLSKSIAELWRVLKPGGLIIASLLSRNDLRYQQGREIEPHSFIDMNDPTEADVVHHFTDESEARKFFSAFEIIKLEEVRGFSARRRLPNAHWEIIGKKI